MPILEHFGLFSIRISKDISRGRLISLAVRTSQILTARFNCLVYIHIWLRRSGIVNALSLNESGKGNSNGRASQFS